MTQAHDPAPEPDPAQPEPAVPGFQAPPPQAAGYVYEVQPTHTYDQPPVPQPYPTSYGYPVGPLPQVPTAYGPVGRPGVVTASAVLAFVQAGITAFATLFMFTTLFDSGFSSGRLAAQTLAVLTAALGVGLLIAGGVRITSGNDRTMLMVACVLEVVICLYYLIVFATLSDSALAPDASSGFDGDVTAVRGFFIFFAVMFSVLPIISLALSRSAAATGFLRARAAR